MTSVIAGRRAGGRHRPSPQAAVAVVFSAGMFMSVMDSQIVNVAVASLGRDFSASPAQVQWVITGYLLSIAASIPLSGWLGDRLGTTRVYLASLAAFGASSALCAVAQNLPELVGARILQGLGAGFIWRRRQHHGRAPRTWNRRQPGERRIAQGRWLVHSHRGGLPDSRHQVATTNTGSSVIRAGRRGRLRPAGCRRRRG
jgi:hypothetical protein